MAARLRLHQSLRTTAPFPARSHRHVCCRAITGNTTLAAPASYRVRLVRSDEDAAAVARVCGAAFGNLSAMVDTQDLDEEQAGSLQQLQDRYGKLLSERMLKTLRDALASKSQAALTHREARLRRQTAQMAAQLALLQGKRATFPGIVSPEEQRQAARWLRSRRFACVYASDDTGKVVGTMTLSMLQPEALLPPPFPTTAPYRAFISNAAVLKDHRRRGVAKAMLQACLRIASFWGVDTVWLHVHKKNQGARMLYESMGFTPATTKGLPTVMSLLGEVLLVRPVQQHSCSMPGSKAVAISEGVLQESSIAKQEPAGCSGSGSYQWGLKELQQDEPT